MLLLVAADDAGRLAPVMAGRRRHGRRRGRARRRRRTPGSSRSAAPRIELRHPLVRSAIYQAASSRERRRAHLALADAIAGGAGRRPARVAPRRWPPSGPTPAIADELERTAERARQRSGHAAAATALQRAAELSVDDASRGRRLVAAARAAWQAGPLATALRAAGAAGDPARRRPAAAGRARCTSRGRSNTAAAACATPRATLLDGADEIAPRGSRARRWTCSSTVASPPWTRASTTGSCEAGDAARQLPLDGDARRPLPRPTLIARRRRPAGRAVPGPSRRCARCSASADDLTSRAACCGPRSPRAWRAITRTRSRCCGAPPRGLARAARSTRSPSCSRASRWAAWSSGRDDAATDAAEGLSLAVAAGLCQLRDPAPGVPRVVRRHPGRRRAVPCARGRGAGRGPPGVRGPGELPSPTGASRCSTSRAARPAEAATRLADLRVAPVGVGHRFIVLHAMSDLVEAAVRCDLRAVAEDALPTLERRAGPGGAGLAAGARGALPRPAGGWRRGRARAPRGRPPADRRRTSVRPRAHRAPARRAPAPRRGSASTRASTCARRSRPSTRWARRPGASAPGSSCAPPARPPASATRARSWQLTPQELQVARLRRRRASPTARSRRSCSSRRAPSTRTCAASSRSSG